MLKKILMVNRLVILLVSFILISINIDAQVKGIEAKNGKWSLVNSSGKAIGSAIYDNMGNNGNFSDGLLSVTLKRKSGYIDTTGKVIIPLKYDECNMFEFETATVWSEGLCGLIDTKGKILIPIKYSLIENSWDDTKVAVSIYNKTTERPKYGLFTRTGKQVYPVSYNEIKDMEELAVGKEKPKTDITSTEREVIPGLFTMEVENSLKQQGGDLYGHINIYSDGATFLYVKENDNKRAVNYIDAMLQFKKFKTGAGFIEGGTINYTSPSKIVFAGFYGLQPDPLKKDEYTDEGYVFFSRPGINKDCWIIHYRLGKDINLYVKDEMEVFLKTVKFKAR